jgi:putative ABC transport system permease protein
MLSYGLWQREFSSDASELGRTIRLGDQPFTVVGVMPRSFQFPIQPEPIDLWTTVAFDARGSASMIAQRGAHYLDVIAVLKKRITLAQAQAEMAAIASALNKEYPENKPRSVRIVPEIQTLIGPVRAALLVLLAAVGCVLLIVCANVANLLLVRATGRRKEMAIRASLGAGDPRVTRQLLTESAALGLLGGGAGLALASALVRVLIHLIPAEVPRLNAASVDGRLLGFAFAISLLMGILCGLAPAVRAMKINLAESLRESGRSTGSDGKAHRRLCNALVVSEIALAAVLLPCAGLLIQGFLHLIRVDPGFDPHRILTFQLDSPAGKDKPMFLHDLVASIGAIPSVRSTSAVASLPLTGDNIRSSIEIEGKPMPLGQRSSVDFNAVEPNYFRTLGIPLLAGRVFEEHDDSKSTPVAIVNRTLARRFFPGQDPIGRHIRPGIGNGYSHSEPPMREIVGVIGDVKQDLGAEAAPEVYAPLAQSPFSTLFVVVRTANDPLSIAGTIRRGVASLARNKPVYRIETLDQYFALSCDAAFRHSTSQRLCRYGGAARLPGGVRSHLSHRRPTQARDRTSHGLGCRNE